MNSEDGQVYSVCILQFSCFTMYTLMQSKQKKNKKTKCEHSIADETLTNYSFLSTSQYTKSKNYLKRRYRIRHLNSHVYWDTLYIKVFFALGKKTIKRVRVLWVSKFYILY